MKDTVFQKYVYLTWIHTPMLWLKDIISHKYVNMCAVALLAWQLPLRHLHEYILDLCKKNEK